MNSQQKIINLLTICRKAGKLVIGFDAVKEAVLGANVSCVIVMDDISENTLKEIRYVCKDYKTDIIQMRFNSYDMLRAVGKQSVAAAVCDDGFAAKIREMSKDDINNNNNNNGKNSQTSHVND